MPAATEALRRGDDEINRDSRVLYDGRGMNISGWDICTVSVYVYLGTSASVLLFGCWLMQGGVHKTP